MKRLVVLLFIALGCTPSLERGRWNDATYSALKAVVEDSSNRGGYAVFDCDFTSVIHDVAHTLMVYQIENLRFATAPSHNFLDGLADVDFPLEVLGVSAREMGESLSAEYSVLRSRLEAGESLESIHADSLYLDFRARFLAFGEGVDESYDYGTVCLWMPALAVGFSDDELRELGRESLSYWLSQGSVWYEEWSTPDGQYTEKAEKGLIVTAEMKNLYASLAGARITPYICSASPEWLVELLACDPLWGFGIPEDHVFGLRLQDTEDGSWSYRTDYIQPYKEGKVACIRDLIAPAHEGREPVLVAGDSNGDVAMLTSFPDMKVGLIIDVGRTGPIDSLARLNDGRYFSQIW